jgi:hypothetical protein
MGFRSSLLTNAAVPLASSTLTEPLLSKEAPNVGDDDAETEEEIDALSSLGKIIGVVLLACGGYVLLHLLVAYFTMSIFSFVTDVSFSQDCC